MSDDTTVVLTDIKEALAKTEKEAIEKPAALLVVGGELNGTLFNLIDPEILIGRSADNGVPLDFNGISRHHFKILTTEKNVIIHDLGSKNGTYVNNQRLEAPKELVKGDIIKIGSIALKYIPKGDPERLTLDKLNQAANMDKHTGCYNKTYFNNTLALEVKKSKLTGDPLSLILFDLDHFKKLNDNYGHDAGDYVLKATADVVRNSGVRDNDIFARYGGEEFVILLPKTNLKQAYEIAERLRKLVEIHHFIYEQKKLPVTASIGVADYRPGVLSGLDLFKRADEAVYTAKNAGRNQVQFYRA
jgi:two-component system, cell cycle response regulator